MFLILIFEFAIFPMSFAKHAIILLAGSGSRLKPLTDKTHKCLIPIGGKTILERQIHQLHKNGIENFHLVVGHRADEIKDFARKYLSDCGRLYFYDNPLHTQTNNAYSLLQALRHVDQAFLLMDGDLLLSDELAGRLRDRTGHSVVLTDTDTSRLDSEAMKLSANRNGDICRLGKDIPLSEACGEAIGASLYQRDWTRRLGAYLKEIMRERKNWNLYYEDALQRLIHNQEAPAALKVLSTDGLPWVEVDEPADLSRAQMIFGGGNLSGA